MTIFQPTISLGMFTDINGVVYEDTYLDANNNIAMIFGVDSVAQTVKNAISLWQAEYQFDTTIGIPWLNILGQLSNQLLLNSYIQNSVLAVPYVTNIISIDYNQENSSRRLQVTVKYNNTDKTVGVANANI